MRYPRLRRGAGVAALCAAALVFASLPASASSAAGASAALTVNQPVIVVLANQYSNLPDTTTQHAARLSALSSAQAPFVSALNSSGARNVRPLSVINALSATVSPAEEATLRTNPDVSEIVPDSAIKVQSGLTLPTSTLTAASRASSSAKTAKTAASSVTLPAGTCAADGGVQLNPQAVEAINADSDVPGAKTARSLGFTGSGVIAVGASTTFRSYAQSDTDGYDDIGATG